MDKVSISLLIGGAVSASLLQSTDKASSALKNLNGNLQKLERAAKSADDFGKLKASLDQTRQKLKEAGAETARLAVAMRTVKEPSDGLKKAFEAAKRQSEGLKREYREQVSSLSALRSQLRAAGVDTANYAKAQAGLVGSLARVREAQERLTAAQAARTANRQAINSLYAQGLEAGALALAMSRALRPAIEFESQMANVAKVVEFQSTAAMREFEGTIKSLSREIPLTAAQLAEIAAAGGRLGISADQLPDFVQIVARMATAFDLLPSEAGEAVAKLSNIFNIPINDIERLGDAINQLANNTAAREADIVNVLTRIGGTSQQFELTVNQTAALADAFLALGRPPQVAATAINALLNKLQAGEAQGKKFQDALAGLGTSSEALAAQIRRDPQQALLDFLQTLSKLDNQTRAVALTNLFGQEYSDDISILVGGLDEYRKALGLVADETQFAGGVQREFGKQSATSANQLKLLLNSLNEVANNFGTALLPTVVEVAGALRVISSIAAEVVAAMPALSTAVGLVAAGFIGWRVASIALRLSLALLRQPLLAISEFLAAINAASVASSTAMRTAATAAAAQAAGVTSLRTSLVGLVVQLKAAAGGIALISAQGAAFAPLIAAVGALAFGWYKVYEAAKDADAAQKRIIDNAEAYRRDLQQTIDLNARYADVQVKTAEQIQALSATERREYEAQIDGAEQYWRARNLLEQEGTRVARSETLARLDETRRGLSGLAAALGDIENRQRLHTERLAEAKDLETGVIRAAFEKQKSVYDEELKKLDQIAKARQVFAEKIAELQKPPETPGSDLIRDTVLAPIKELQRGQDALDTGKFKDAEASANRVVEQLKALADAGKISRSFLQSLTQQASELGDRTFDALEAQQNEKIESAKQKLLDLKSDFDFLQSIEIGVDTEGAIASVEALRDRLQQIIKDNPIVVPVEAGASGDIPKLKDLDGKASGGPITGPGPKGRDGVLMWGAPGEHMLTAAEVDAAGGHGAIFRLRRALRSGWLRKAITSGGIPGFAAGGPIVPQLPSVQQLAIPSSPSVSGAPITFVLDGKRVTVDAVGDSVDALRRMIRIENLKQGIKG